MQKFGETIWNDSYVYIRYVNTHDGKLSLDGRKLALHFIKCKPSNKCP